MILKSINTQNDYQQALKRLEIIFDAKKGTPQGDELEALSILIEKYEDEHFQIGLIDSNDAKKFQS